jgi:hypothetical protein
MRVVYIKAETIPESRLLKDGVELFRGTTNACKDKLAELCPNIQWAVAHGGYRIEFVNFNRTEGHYAAVR